MATATFFGVHELKDGWRPLLDRGDTAGGAESIVPRERSNHEPLSIDDMATSPFPWDADFAQQHELVGRFPLAGEESMGRETGSEEQLGPLQYCLLSFHAPVITPPSSIILGSRLDTTGIESTSSFKTGDGDAGGFGLCEGSSRIAFHGRLVAGTLDHEKGTTPSSGGNRIGTETRQLKLYSEKVKKGVVFRVGAASGVAHLGDAAVEVLGKDLFKKETNMSPFIGMLVHTPVGSLPLMCSMSLARGKMPRRGGSHTAPPVISPSCLEVLVGYGDNMAMSMSPSSNVNCTSKSTNPNLTSVGTHRLHFHPP